jgi:hypothetical protein
MGVDVAGNVGNMGRVRDGWRFALGRRAEGTRARPFAFSGAGLGLAAVADAVVAGLAGDLLPDAFEGLPYDAVRRSGGDAVGLPYFRERSPVDARAYDALLPLIELSKVAVDAALMAGGVAGELGV